MARDGQCFREEKMVALISIETGRSMKTVLGIPVMNTG